jgi:hypothetical protein
MASIHCGALPVSFKGITCTVHDYHRCLGGSCSCWLFHDKVFATTAASRWETLSTSWRDGRLVGASNEVMNDAGHAFPRL